MGARYNWVGHLCVQKEIIRKMEKIRIEVHPSFLSRNPVNIDSKHLILILE